MEPQNQQKYTKDGYADYSIARRDGKPGSLTVYVHRWMFERFVGPIPERYEIDHLCKNPRCVNFDHMEPVTKRVNLQRAHRQALCKKGHDLSIHRRLFGKYTSRCGLCYDLEKHRRIEEAVARRGGRKRWTKKAIARHEKYSHL